MNIKNARIRNLTSSIRQLTDRGCVEEPHHQIMFDVGNITISMIAGEWTHGSTKRTENGFSHWEVASWVKETGVDHGSRQWLCIPEFIQSWDGMIHSWVSKEDIHKWLDDNEITLDGRRLRGMGFQR